MSLDNPTHQVESQSFTRNGAVGMEPTEQLFIAAGRVYLRIQQHDALDQCGEKLAGGFLVKSPGMSQRDNRSRLSINQLGGGQLQKESVKFSDVRRLGDHRVHLRSVFTFVGHDVAPASHHHHWCFG